MTFGAADGEVLTESVSRSVSTASHRGGVRAPRRLCGLVRRGAGRGVDGGVDDDGE